MATAAAVRVVTVALVGRRTGDAAAGGGALGERGLRASGAGRAGVAVEPHGLPLLPRPRRRSARIPRLWRGPHPLPRPYAEHFLFCLRWSYGLVQEINRFGSPTYPH
jgi:hypothetical protein